MAPPFRERGLPAVRALLRAPQSLTSAGASAAGPVRKRVRAWRWPPEALPPPESQGAPPRWRETDDADAGASPGHPGWPPFPPRGAEAPACFASPLPRPRLPRTGRRRPCAHRRATRRQKTSRLPWEAASGSASSARRSCHPRERGGGTSSSAIPTPPRMAPACRPSQGRWQPPGRVPAGRAAARRGPLRSSAAKSRRQRPRTALSRLR